MAYASYNGTFPSPPVFSENFSNAQREEQEAKSCEASGRLHAALRHFNQAEVLVTMEATAHSGADRQKFLDYARTISVRKATIHQKLLRRQPTVNSHLPIDRHAAYLHAISTQPRPAATPYPSIYTIPSHTSQTPQSPAYHQPPAHTPAYVQPPAHTPAYHQPPAHTPAYHQPPAQPPNPISHGGATVASRFPVASAIVVKDVSALQHLPASVATISPVVGTHAPHAQPIVTAVPAYPSTVRHVAATPIAPRLTPAAAPATPIAPRSTPAPATTGPTLNSALPFRVGEFAEANVNGQFYVCSIMSAADASGMYTVGFSNCSTKRLHATALRRRPAVAPPQPAAPSAHAAKRSDPLVDGPSYPLIDPSRPSVAPRGIKRLDPKAKAKAKANAEWPPWFQNCSSTSLAAVVSYALTPKLWQSALQPTKMPALKFPQATTEADRYAVRPPTDSDRDNGEAASILRVTRYAPGVFRSIREAAGISEAAYYRSMVGSDMLHGGKLGEGKSGMLFFRSVDSRFVVKTLKATELTKFFKMAEGYHKHLTRALDKDSTMPTLISHFYDIFEIEGAEPEDTSVGPGISKNRMNMRQMILVVMNNVFHCDKGILPLLMPHNHDKLRNNVLPLHQVFDLKGSTVKRHVVISDQQSRYGHRPWSFGPDERAPKCPTLKDTNLTENDINKLFVCPKERSRLLDILRNDAQFLMGHNIMDYSLLVGVFRQQHVPHARHKFRNIAFIAVIDILQDYNMRKKMENLFKRNILPTVKNLGEMLGVVKSPKAADQAKNADELNISAIQAPEYCARFLNFMEGEVLAVVSARDGTNTFKHLPNGANFCSFTVKI